MQVTYMYVGHYVSLNKIHTKSVLIQGRRLYFIAVLYLIFKQVFVIFILWTLHRHMDPYLKITEKCILRYSQDLLQNEPTSLHFSSMSNKRELGRIISKP